MIIITTLYNAEKYIERCLFSIKTQTFKDFKCYITDDLSTDNSVNLVKNFIKTDDRFILIENSEKLYQPGNYDQVIRNNPDIDNNDVIVEIDGDDWLPDSDALNRINLLRASGDVTSAQMDYYKIFFNTLYYGI